MKRKQRAKSRSVARSQGNASRSSTAACTAESSAASETESFRGRLGLVEPRRPVSRWMALTASPALVASAVVPAWFVLCERTELGVARRRGSPVATATAEGPDAPPR